MKIWQIVIIFVLGFLTSQALMNFGNYEKPFSLQSLTGMSSSITGKVIAPEGLLSSSDIEFYKDKIVINVANATLSKYAATGSMIPTLNENSKGIKVPVTNVDQLHIGDIITFKEESSGDLIIHRIVGIGFDDLGNFYITKGDNNLVSDGKIRFEQIKYKLVALVY